MCSLLARVDPPPGKLHGGVHKMCGMSKACWAASGSAPSTCRHARTITVGAQLFSSAASKTRELSSNYAADYRGCEVRHTCRKTTSTKKSSGNLGGSWMFKPGCPHRRRFGGLSLSDGAREFRTGPNDCGGNVLFPSLALCTRTRRRRPKVAVANIIVTIYPAQLTQY